MFKLIHNTLYKNSSITKFTHKTKHYKSLILPSYSSFAQVQLPPKKSNPSSGITKRKFEEKMGKRIASDPEPIMDVTSRTEIPEFMSKLLFRFQIPSVALAIGAFTSGYYSINYSNSLCLLFDWCGFLFAATGGIYFTLAATKYEENRSISMTPEKKYLLSLFPILTTMVSLALITNFHYYSFFGIGFGFLNSLYFDNKMCSEGTAPKYWLSFKFRQVIWANLFILFVLFSIFNFNEHIESMKKLLATYEALGRDEYDMVKPEVDLSPVNLLKNDQKLIVDKIESSPDTPLTTQNVLNDPTL